MNKNFVNQTSKFVLKYCPWIVVLFFAILFYSYTFDPKIHHGGDNAEYYQLGQGFTLNKGYVNAMLVGEPAAVHYPPGYPFILSIPMRLGISDIFWLKCLNGLFYFGIVVLLFKLVYALESKWIIATMVTLICITNAELLIYSSILMSEIPYTFTSLLSIYALFKYQQQDFEAQIINSYAWLALAILSGVASYYIRSIGVVIPIALVLFFAFERNWKALIISFSTSVLLIVPWILRMNALGGGSYKSQLMQKNPYRPELGEMDSLSDWGARFFANLKRYVGKEIESTLINTMNFGPQIESQWWMNAVGVGLLVLGIVGLYSLDKRVRTFLILFILGHFGVLMLWPEVWFGTRFMLSMAPILYYLLIKSTFFVWEKTKLRNVNSKLIGYGLFVVILLFQIRPLKMVNAYAEGDYNPRYKEYFDLAEAVKTQFKDENMVISCRKPAFFYLLSGKKVTSYLFTSDHDELIKNLQENNVTHVVLDNLGFSSTSRYLLPAVQNRPDYFRVIAQREGANTYFLKLLNPNSN